MSEEGCQDEAAVSEEAVPLPADSAGKHVRTKPQQAAGKNQEEAEMGEEGCQDEAAVSEEAVPVPAASAGKHGRTKRQAGKDQDDAETVELHSADGSQDEVEASEEAAPFPACSMRRPPRTANRRDVAAGILRRTLATEKSYITLEPPGASKRFLLVAVTEGQAKKHGMSHTTVVNTLWEQLADGDVTKEVALTLRSKLLPN